MSKDRFTNQCCGPHPKAPDSLKNADYPTWNRITEEQSTDLLELQRLVEAYHSQALKRIAERLPTLGTTWAQQAYFDGFNDCLTQVETILKEEIHHE